MKILLACLLSALHLSSVGAEAGQNARYTLKQTEASTGTNIKREVAFGGLPFDKRYAELTSEQQAQLKAQYEQMGADDEPPFPIDGLGRIYQAISAAQDKLLITGSLSVAVEVDSSGEAVSVSVLKSSDARMTKYVAAVLMDSRYKPALCAGTPCTMQFPFRMQFQTRP